MAQQNNKPTPDFVKSMTGFAAATGQSEIGDLSWEIRTVNNRYLDVQFKISDEMRPLQAEFKKLVSSHLTRGKVDCALKYSKSAQVKNLQVDTNMVAAMIDKIRIVNELAPELGSPTAIDVLNWPGVVIPPTVDISRISEQVIEILRQTLEQLVRMRTREGAHIAGVIKQKVVAMQALIEEIRNCLPEILTEVRDRLTERVKQLLEHVEPQRLEQEVVMLADKMDVEEELDRIDAHLNETLRCFESDKPVGRRLDFIMQELHREINTLGAKCVNQRVAQKVVEVKVLIEQMREQVQNIE